jgi:hypothetical protein
MTDAEIFLAVWAVVSTGFAVYFQNRYQRSVAVGTELLKTFIDVAEGKATVVKRGTRIRIDYGDDDGNTSK